MSQSVIETRQFHESRYLWLLQLVAWLIVFISAMLIAVNIPIFYAYILKTSDLSIDANLIAWIRSLLRRFGELIFFTVALGIMLRSEEPIAILLAMFAASVGAMYGGSYIEIVDQVSAPLVFTSTIVASLPSMLGILLLFILPNGEFFPKIGRYLVFFIAIFEPIRIFFSVTESLQTISYILFVPTLLVASLGVWAQARRYAQGTPIYKQQFKWLIFGAGIYIASIALLIIGLFSLPRAWSILVQGLDEVGGVIMAISLLLAVTQSRLYDIDLFINRSLVYGSAFLGVGLLFIALFAILQAVLVAIPIIGQFTAIVIAGALSVLLLNPTIRFIQHWIDTRIYGLRFDINQLSEYVTAPSSTSEGRYKGQVIDEYEVITMIGHGGLCEVYLAKKQQDLFAFKILLENKRYNSDARSRFASEAAITAEMAHPNVVQLYEHHSFDASNYIVLPYIEGQSLAQYLEAKGTLTQEGAYTILKDIVAALEYVHAKGIVHRDLKPSNVLIQEPDERAILVDFGLAKHINAEDAPDSGAIGTIAYMAPEQIRNGRAVDHRADLYALGVMSFQLLTGQLPFDGSAGNMLFGHLNQPAPDPSTIRPSIPESVAFAIQKAMSKDPDDRYPSASAFLAALSS